VQERYALFKRVLKIFHDAGILDEMILVGSWSMHFYRDYFARGSYQPTIRTRDIDFLVPTPIRSGLKVDVCELLREDGFVVTFNHSGFMRLEHPEIIIEFLVPEKGKGKDKPFPLPHLGVNAQALRFLDFLIQNSIVIQSSGLHIRVPHPAAFGLHKLIISERRKTVEKSLKERREAISVLNTLIAQGESKRIVDVFNSMPAKWQKRACHVLEEAGEDILLKILK